VQDIVEKRENSRTLNNDKNRDDYLRKFPKESIPNKSAAKKISTSNDFKEIPLNKVKKRKYLAPPNIVCSLNSPTIERMLKELQAIDYNKFPNASHDLIRSFLECSLKGYFAEKDKKVNKKGAYVFLDDVLGEFKNEMDLIDNIGLSQLAQTIKTDQNMQRHSAKFLNAINHNNNIFATGRDVEDAWDKIEPLLRFILNPTI
jgi:hypothetical protein